MSAENKYVLIIEDNATDVTVLQSLLKRSGVDSTVLFDSRRITDILEEVTIPDAIFLDLELPGISGYEVLQIIQENPNFQNVPVVAYTSHLSEMRAARDAGFHSFLGKPLKGTKFEEQIANIFDGNSVWEGR